MNLQISSEILQTKANKYEIRLFNSITSPEKLEADLRMNNGLPALDMLAPLFVYDVGHLSMNCSSNHRIDSKEHHLLQCNPQRLFLVDGVDLAPSIKKVKVSHER